MVSFFVPIRFDSFDFLFYGADTLSTVGVRTNRGEGVRTAHSKGFRQIGYNSLILWKIIKIVAVGSVRTAHSQGFGQIGYNSLILWKIIKIIAVGSVRTAHSQGFKNCKQTGIETLISFPVNANFPVCLSLLKIVILSES